MFPFFLSLIRGIFSFLLILGFPFGNAETIVEIELPRQRKVEQTFYARSDPNTLLCPTIH